MNREDRIATFVDLAEAYRTCPVDELRSQWLAMLADCATTVNVILPGQLIRAMNELMTRNVMNPQPVTVATTPQVVPHRTKHIGRKRNPSTEAVMALVVGESVELDMPTCTEGKNMRARIFSMQKRYKRKFVIRSLCWGTGRYKVTRTA